MKNTVIAALLIMLTTACQREQQEPQLAISFSATQEETRSSFVGSEGIPIDGAFGISASSAPGGVWDAGSATMDYFFNKDVVRKEHEYVYLGTEFWPLQPLRFFAYYPFRARNLTLSSPSKRGYPTLDLTVDQSVAEQYDLMVGVTAVLTPTHSVVVPFRHALTRVGFSFRTTSAALIVINSIEVNNIVSRGVQSYDSQGRITWSLRSEFKSNYTLSTTSGELMVGIPLSGSYTELTTKRGYLLMIPQTIATADVVVRISYTENGIQKEFNTALPQSEWRAGVYVNYQITIPS